MTFKKNAPAHCPPRVLAFSFCYPQLSSNLGCLEKGSLGLSPVVIGCILLKRSTINKFANLSAKKKSSMLTPYNC